VRARLLPYGPGAWLLEVDVGGDVLAAATAVARSEAVNEVVPAARTVLVHLAPGVDRDEIGRQLLELVSGAEELVVEDPSHAVELDVTYDGEDLAAVAEACGLTTDEVISRHSGATYRAAFCGFAPGFAYLTGLDPALELPRRASPRTRVPAGSVAIAADYSAVYPTTSPGGWHLLGHTDAVLFDADRDPPALIVPGATVRFAPT
jgi:KipI family sensor histidine kinase inhibitor